MIKLLEAMKHEDLTTSERMLIVSLFSMSDFKGQSKASYKEIELLSGLSKPSVWKLLESLADRGFITITRGNANTANQYQLDMKRLWLNKRNNSARSNQVKDKITQVLEGLSVSEKKKILGSKYPKAEFSELCDISKRTITKYWDLIESMLSH